MTINRTDADENLIRIDVIAFLRTLGLPELQSLLDQARTPPPKTGTDAGNAEADRRFGTKK